LNTHCQGPAGARNQGIELAAGAFIAFLDSDDLWKPWHLERGVEILDANRDLSWFYADMEQVQNEMVVVHSVKHELWQNREKFIVEKRGNLRILQGPTLLVDAIRYGTYAEAQVSIIRRNVFEKISYDERLQVGEDRLLPLEAINNGFKLGYILDCHCSYRIHSNHISNAGEKKDVSSKLITLRKLESYYELIEEKIECGKEEKNAIKEKLSTLYFWQFGYSTLWRNGKHQEALSYYLKGIHLRPTNLTFWKTFFLALLRLAFYQH
jgi:glycosyltransferase involved in cell wall biosynthesis